MTEEELRNEYINTVLPYNSEYEVWKAYKLKEIKIEEFIKRVRETARDLNLI